MEEDTQFESINDGSKQRIKILLDVMDDESLMIVLRITKAFVNRRMIENEPKVISSVFNQDENDSDHKRNPIAKYDLQLLSDLQTLIKLYIRTGTFRFSEIIKDLYTETDSKLEYYLIVIKDFYSAYYTHEATDAEAEKMDSNLRPFTLASILHQHSMLPSADHGNSLLPLWKVEREKKRTELQVKFENETISEIEKSVLFPYSAAEAQQQVKELNELTGQSFN